MTRPATALWISPDFKPANKPVVGITRSGRPALAIYNQDLDAWLECEPNGELKIGEDDTLIYLDIELWTPIP